MPETQDYANVVFALFHSVKSYCIFCSTYVQSKYEWWISSKGFILIELVNLNVSKTILQYIQSKYKMWLSILI